ncbi:Predicted oxidoreductase [Halogranum amylolyticum]|uniref:Predicted oxidoreductase n=1 Tax=Halogranum amylolyticum TaxID=660520 RepID=A0A1H8PJY8_9EURY|nr:aldo/keto reductase [Halogranum amylolyticum]SEO42101.1 Predicted oxidoreductase [Halogranum amylolyticum]
MATHQGTWSYRDRFGDSFGRTYFRRFGPGVVSSVGVGTYLGDPTAAVDDHYHDALVTAFESGVNIVDTAINYRCQRSERVVGRALRDADVERSEVVVATKGGFLPFDGSRPDNPGRYVQERFVDTGLVDTDDLAHGSHCIAPDVLDELLDRSLDNLDLDAVDCYYVHNPETQLAVRSREAVYDQLEAAFTRLEKRRTEGDIGGYGVASWNAFRVPEDHEQYLSLPEVVARAEAAAEAAGNEESGLTAIQLPFNVVMADAFTVRSHPTDDGPASALEYAHDQGLSVFTSASIAQGELARELPEAIAAELAGDSTVQRAINFARSAPGVTCALVGTSRQSHLAENVAAGTFDPLGAQAFDAVFE